MEQLALITAENVVYADESGMDNRDEYAYGWNKSGQRFHALKSGRRQGRVNMIAAYCNHQLINTPDRFMESKSHTGEGDRS